MKYWPAIVLAAYSARSSDALRVAAPSPGAVGLSCTLSLCEPYPAIDVFIRMSGDDSAGGADGQPPQSAEERRLERVLVAELSTALSTRRISDALHRAICAYVEHLRDQGALPERAVIAVKAIVGRVIPRDDHDAYWMADSLITMCIRAYYAG